MKCSKCSNEETPGADIPTAASSNIYREELILKYVVNKDVLDCGIVGGGNFWRQHLEDVWLHARITRLAQTCLGVDVQSEELEAIRCATGFEVSFADVEALTFQERFDVVVAGELVEHLHNMGRFLDGAWRSLREGGLLLITTPNNYALSKLLYALVLGREVCHSEHTCYYSRQTLCYMLKQHGFVVAREAVIPREARTRIVSAAYRWVSRIRPTLGEILFVVAQKRSRS